MTNRRYYTPPPTVRDSAVGSFFYTTRDFWISQRHPIDKFGFQVERLNIVVNQERISNLAYYLQVERYLTSHCTTQRSFLGGTVRAFHHGAVRVSRKCPS